MSSESALTWSSRSIHEIERLFQDNNISSTRPRRSIARIMFEKPAHYSAEQITDRLAADGEQVSRATVYNTLRLFAAKGLLKEVLVDASKTIFDSNTREHHHFYDTQTGTITDIDEAQLNISELPQIPAGMEIDAIDITIRLRPIAD